MKLYASNTKTMIVSRSCTMHPQSPPITIAGTVLKESDDLVKLGVTFDSNLTFEKHLRLVFRAASKRLGILKKSWRVFHDRSLLERCFRCFVLPVFEYCSAVWCSAADTPLLDHAVSGVRFLTGGVFECDIAHRRSVAVLCMLYKNRCNPIDPPNDGMWTVCTSAGCTPCPGSTSVYLCTTSLQNLAVPQTFVLLSVSLWNDLADPVFDGVGLAGLKSKANDFLLA